MSKNREIKKNEAEGAPGMRRNEGEKERKERRERVREIQKEKTIYFCSPYSVGRAEKKSTIDSLTTVTEWGVGGYTREVLTGGGYTKGECIFLISAPKTAILIPWLGERG
ncbi:hypothetical protein AVEN_204715-1 [Araneus ventricosus]|uniref:Uncharacterized protein n=1 Tax=Araneus ventricosus TaxID=182803 RepID=A0A4Y2P264_ARAVE|nr:hypothetical protein AVEN_204715-1 [Araneus ventricosus]